jgi:hypothetical protein
MFVVMLVIVRVVMIVVVVVIMMRVVLRIHLGLVIPYFCSGRAGLPGYGCVSAASA